MLMDKIVKEPKEKLLSMKDRSMDLGSIKLIVKIKLSLGYMVLKLIISQDNLQQLMLLFEQEINGSPNLLI